MHDTTIPTNQYYVESNVLHRSESSFQSFVGAIQASGGGDAAEDIMGALSVTFSKLSWRDHGTKVRYLVVNLAGRGYSSHSVRVCVCVSVTALAGATRTLRPQLRY